MTNAKPFNKNAPRKTPPFLPALECFAALGLLFLLLASLAAIVHFSLTRPSQQLSVEIEGNAKKLARTRSIINNARNNTPDTQKLLLEKLSGDFFTGLGAPIAIADLQTTIGNIITKNASTLVQARQIEITSAIIKSNPELTPLGLNIRFRGPIINVYKIIHQIETNKPVLIIQSAKMSIFGDPTNRLLSSGKIPSQLIVEIALFGLLKPADGATK